MISNSQGDKYCYPPRGWNVLSSLISGSLVLLALVLPVVLVQVSYPPNMYQINALSLPTRTLPYQSRYHILYKDKYRSSIAGTTTTATTTTRQYATSTTASHRRHPQPPPETLEEIQNEIVELREIATDRLEALLEQMEDLKRMNNNNNNDIIYPHQPPHPVVDDNSKVIVTGAESVVVSTNTNNVAAVNVADTTNRIKAPEGTKEIQQLPTVEVNPSSKISEASSNNLLDDTTWKIVYNIGREKGTWMPKEWGVSGDRLLFQCTVQFTKESLLPLSSQHDEFFHGSTDTKQLLVQDAFIIPRGVGDSSVGRRPLPVQSVGAYKVCRNQGPFGTGIVRFYIELTNIVTVPDHTSDVHCPSGRIYATCGYFPIPSKHDATTPSKRDMAHEHYKDALREYERIQAEINTDTRGVFNIDHVKLMMQSWNTKQRLEETASKFREAQQQEPEKAQLRLNMDQTIGLTRTGGVCCKVQKGLALEYHILGKIEVGCMNVHESI
jgi:hypothetical protein